MQTRRQAIVSGTKALAGYGLTSGSLTPFAMQRPAGPGARAGHAMAWHAGAEAICLLGGDHDGVDVTREQPWFWDGHRWTMRATTGQGPAVTSLVAAASDPDRRSVLAFGGFSVLGPRRYGPPAGELWELEATLTWRRHAVRGLQPGPRHHHAVAFDTARGRLVLYGGIDASDKWDSDVWEWDRDEWRRISTTQGPGERAHHAMAYDQRRGCVVFRGGTRRDKVRPPETWEWDGKAWRESAAEGAGPGDGYRMAYDTARNVTVLFGGDTCLWNGATWTRVATSLAPAARAVHALACDPVRRCVVLHGGSAGQQRLADTWEWDGAVWREVNDQSAPGRVNHAPPWR